MAKRVQFIWIICSQCITLTDWFSFKPIKVPLSLLSGRENRHYRAKISILKDPWFQILSLVERSDLVRRVQLVEYYHDISLLSIYYSHTSIFSIYKSLEQFKVHFPMIQNIEGRQYWNTSTTVSLEKRLFRRIEISTTDCLWQ